MSKQLRTMMARKMLQKHIKMERPNASRPTSKGNIRDVLMARINKKKIPSIHISNPTKDPKYAKMSITQWERKYLE